MGYGANTVVTKLNYRQKPKTINTFIYEGKIKVDSNYFIKKINKGIKDSEYNYKTYVGSKMTDWQFFNGDKNINKFFKNIKPVLDEIEIPHSKMTACWGLRYEKGDYARQHHHKPATWCGIIYLSKGGVSTYFSDYDVHVEPEIGKFVLFSGVLLHGTATSESKKPRYALSFNFNFENPRFNNNEASFKG